MTAGLSRMSACADCNREMIVTGAEFPPSLFHCGCDGGAFRPLWAPQLIQQNNSKDENRG